MRKIGILYGMENTFPGAVVDRINALGVEDVRAESILLGGVAMAEPSGLSQERGAGRHADHQQSVLVERRRQVLQLCAGFPNRRGRASHRAAAA